MKITHEKKLRQDLISLLNINDKETIDEIIEYITSEVVPDDVKLYSAEVPSNLSQKDIANILLNMSKNFIAEYNDTVLFGKDSLRSKAVIFFNLANDIYDYNQSPQALKFSLEEVKVIWGHEGNGLSQSNKKSIPALAACLIKIYEKGDDDQKSAVVKFLHETDLVQNNNLLIGAMNDLSSLLSSQILTKWVRALSGSATKFSVRRFNFVSDKSLGDYTGSELAELWNERNEEIRKNIPGFIKQLSHTYSKILENPTLANDKKQIEELIVLAMSDSRIKIQHLIEKIDLRKFIYQLGEIYKNALGALKPGQNSNEYYQKIVLLINNPSLDLLLTESKNKELQSFIYILRASVEMKKNNVAPAMSYIEMAVSTLGKDNDAIEKFNANLNKIGIKNIFSLGNLLSKLYEVHEENKQSNAAIVQTLFSVPFLRNELVKDVASINTLINLYGAVEVDKKPLLLYISDMLKEKNIEIYNKLLPNFRNYIEKHEDKIKKEDFLRFATQVYTSDHLDKESLKNIYAEVKEASPAAAAHRLAIIRGLISNNVSLDENQLYIAAYDEEVISGIVSFREADYRKTFVSGLEKLYQKTQNDKSDKGESLRKHIIHSFIALAAKIHEKDEVSHLCDMLEKYIKPEDVLHNQALDKNLKEILPERHNRLWALQIALKIAPQWKIQNDEKNNELRKHREVLEANEEDTYALSGIQQGDELFKSTISNIYKEINIKNLEELLKDKKLIDTAEAMHRIAILRVFFDRAAEEDVKRICENLPDYNLESSDILNDKVLARQLEEKFPEQYKKLTVKEIKNDVVSHVDELAQKVSSIEAEAQNVKDFVSEAGKNYAQMDVVDLKEILQKTDVFDIAQVSSLENRLRLLQTLFLKISPQEIQEICKNPIVYHLKSSDILRDEKFVLMLKDEALKILILANVFDAIEITISLAEKSKQLTNEIKQEENQTKKVELIKQKQNINNVKEKLAHVILQEELIKNIAIDVKIFDKIAHDKFVLDTGIKDFSFKEGNFEFRKADPYLRAYVLGKLLVDLNLTADALIKIYMNNHEKPLGDDIINAIKFNFQLGNIVDLDMNIKIPAQRHLFLALVKSPYKTSSFTVNSDSLEPYLKELTKDEIKDILKTCHPEVKKNILNQLIPFKNDLKERYPNLDQEFCIKLFHDFIKDIRNLSGEALLEGISRLSLYVNSYEEEIVDIRGIDKNIAPLLQEIFEQDFLYKFPTFFDVINRDCLRAFIAHCVAHPEAKWAKTALDHIVAYTMSDMVKEHPDLINDLRGMFTRAWSQRYAPLVLKDVPKTATPEDYINMGVQLQRALQDPECVAKLEKFEDFASMLENYDRISRLLMAHEYHEMKRLEEAAQKALDTLQAQSILSEDVEMRSEGKEVSRLESKVAHYKKQVIHAKTFQAIEQTKGILNNLKGNADELTDENKKEKIKGFAQKYLEEKLVENKDVYSVLNDIFEFFADETLSDFCQRMLGKPLGDIEKSELAFYEQMVRHLLEVLSGNFVKAELKKPVSVINEGDDVFDENGKKLGVMMKNKEIHYVPVTEEEKKAFEARKEIFKKSAKDSYEARLLEIKDKYRKEIEKIEKAKKSSELDDLAIKSKKEEEDAEKEYQQKLTSIEKMTSMPILQMGIAQIYTVLYDKDRKYVGTLNPNSGIDPELLLDADFAQRMLLDDESFEKMGEKNRNQLFQRIINLEKLPDFLMAACFKEKVMNAFVQYLEKSFPSLRQIDWENVVYWVKPEQIKSIFEAYCKKQKFDDAKILLYALICNFGQASVYKDTKKQFEIFEMFKACKLDAATVETWLSPPSLVHQEIQNLLRVYLLSDKEYVNSLQTHKDKQKFDTTVRALDINENLNGKLVQGLQRPVREKILSSGMYFDKNHYVNLVHDFTADEKKKQIVAFINSLEASEAVRWVLEIFEEPGLPSKPTTLFDTLIENIKSIVGMDTAEAILEYKRDILQGLFQRAKCVRHLALLLGVSTLKTSPMDPQFIADKKLAQKAFPNLIHDIGEIGKTEGSGITENFLHQCFTSLGRVDEERVSKGRVQAIKELSSMLEKGQTDAKREDEKINNLPKGKGKGPLQKHQKTVSKDALEEANGVKSWIKRQVKKVTVFFGGNKNTYLARKQETREEKAARAAKKGQRKAKAKLDKMQGQIVSTANLFGNARDMDRKTADQVELINQFQKIINDYINLGEELIDKRHSVAIDSERIGTDLKKMGTLSVGEFKNITDQLRKNKVLLGNYHKHIGWARDIKNASASGNELQKLLKKQIDKTGFDPVLDVLATEYLIVLADMLDNCPEQHLKLIKETLGDDIKKLQQRILVSISKRLKLLEEKGHTDLLFDFCEGIKQPLKDANLKVLPPDQPLLFDEKLLNEMKNEFLDDDNMYIFRKIRPVEYMDEYFAKHKQEQETPEDKFVEELENPKALPVEKKSEVKVIVSAENSTTVTMENYNPFGPIKQEETLRVINYNPFADMVSKTPSVVSKPLQVSPTNPFGPAKATTPTTTESSHSLLLVERYNFDSPKGNAGRIDGTSIVNIKDQLSKKHAADLLGKEIIFIYPANSKTAKVPSDERHKRILTEKYKLQSGGLGEAFETAQGIHNHGIPTLTAPGGDQIPTEEEILHYVSQLYAYAAQGHLVVLPYHPDLKRFAFGGGVAMDFVGTKEDKLLQGELTKFEQFIKDYNKNNSVRPSGLNKEAFEEGIKNPDADLFRPYSTNPFDMVNVRKEEKKGDTYDARLPQVERSKIEISSSKNPFDFSKKS